MSKDEWEYTDGRPVLSPVSGVACSLSPNIMEIFTHPLQYKVDAFARLGHTSVCYFCGNLVIKREGPCPFCGGSLARATEK